MVTHVPSYKIPGVTRCGLVPLLLPDRYIKISPMLEDCDCKACIVKSKRGDLAIVFYKNQRRKIQRV